MSLFLVTFGFFLGTAIGSFLNVVVLRTHSGKSLEGRSECPHCHHQLAWSDNIPLLSFLFLAGRCRYCKKPISWQYPIVELVTGLSFALICWELGNSFFAALGLSQLTIGFQWLFTLFLTSVLIVISVWDLKWGLIPDKIIFPTIIVSVFYQLIIFSLGVANFGFKSALFSLGADVSAAFLVSLFFFLLIVGTNGKGMGGGDLKLSILIGLSLGWPGAVISTFLAFLTGALAAVMLLLIGLKRFKQTVPFGPFLALGATLACLYSEEILQAYLKTLGL